MTDTPTMTSTPTISMTVGIKVIPIHPYDRVVSLVRMLVNLAILHFTFQHWWIVTDTVMHFNGAASSLLYNLYTRKTEPADKTEDKRPYAGPYELAGLVRFVLVTWINMFLFVSGPLLAYMNDSPVLGGLVLAKFLIIFYVPRFGKYD